MHLDGGLSVPACKSSVFHSLRSCESPVKKTDGLCVFWAPSGFSPHVSLGMAVTSPVVPHCPYQVLCPQQVGPLPTLLPEMKAVTLFSPGKGYLSLSCDLLQPE